MRCGLALIVVLIGTAGRVRAAPPCCATDGPCALPPLTLPALPLPAPFVQTDLEDAGEVAMAPFYADLARTHAGHGKTRIVFFGDSHTANDRWPGRLRAHLQSLFGRAGAGLLMPARHMPWYRHQLAAPGGLGSWTPIAAQRRTPVTDGRVGLSGFALRMRWFKPMRLRIGRNTGSREAGHASQFEVHYLRQPSGGRVRIGLDGDVVATVHTKGVTNAFGRYRFSAGDGVHRLSIAAAGDGDVTILGVTAEREGPGVVVDTLGVVGGRAKEQLGWDDALFAAQLGVRRPNLLVLAYGTNEAMDVHHPIEAYEAELREVVARARGVAKDAACLLIGPTDHPKRRGGRYYDRERTGEIIEAQRRVARVHGCAMFDLVAVTGGPQSMRQLVGRPHFYGARDHVHFTRRGYALLGDALTGALLRGYHRWLHGICAVPQPAAPVPVLRPTVLSRRKPGQVGR